MEPAITSEKQALSQPPLIRRPLTDDVASVASLAYQTLRNIDKTQINTTLPTESVRLMLSTFVQMVEGRNAERVKTEVRR